MKIYLASSWRNALYEPALEALRAAGHEVYDFKNPRAGETGFHWSDVLGPEWRTQTTPRHFRDRLSSPIARAGFRSDMTALDEADAVVLALPCGRSAHLELGWATGKGKPTAILMPPGMVEEPELMYLMVGFIALDTVQLIEWLRLLGEATT